LKTIIIVDLAVREVYNIMALTMLDNDVLDLIPKGLNSYFMFHAVL